MVNNLPCSDIPDLRDYLFVDRQRVGSLLAQFAEGLPSERTSGSSRSRRLQLGLDKFFTHERGAERLDSQTLALADLHVSQLEENAEALGMLADVSEKVEKRKNWLRGKVRSRFEPGMLLRVTAPTQISDVSTIVGSFQSLATVFEGHDEEGTFSEIQEGIQQLKALYGESISVSIRTAGEDDYEVGFVGEIPHDHEFGPMRRQLLLSQVGPGSTTLTTLMQIAAVPTERDAQIGPQEMFRNFMPNVEQLFDEQKLNRRVLDEVMTALGKILAETGFVAAPKWPAISVIPLAIYRQVEQVPDMNGLDGDCD